MYMMVSVIFKIENVAILPCYYGGATLFVNVKSKTALIPFEVLILSNVESGSTRISEIKFLDITLNIHDDFTY
jgi:hypothetical protein